MNNDGIKFEPIGNVKQYSQKVEDSQTRKYEQRVANPQAQENEQKAALRNKFISRAKKVGAAVALTAGLAGAVLANKEAGANQALPREQWEEQMNNELHNYHDLSLIYDSENGSDASFTRGYDNTHFDLHDSNSDGRPESGQATRNGLTVTFEEDEDGTLVSSAIHILDEGLDRGQ